MMRAVEPLPLVPVTWMTGAASWGSPRTRMSSLHRGEREPFGETGRGLEVEVRVQPPPSGVDAQREVGSGSGAAGPVLLPGVLGHEGGVDLVEHHASVDHAPADVVAARAGRT